FSLLRIRRPAPARIICQNSYNRLTFSIERLYKLPPIKPGCHAMPAAGRRRTDSAKPPTPARKPPVRHHQRAIQYRGAATRARLIEAALDSFGRLGFEGASTREIAKAAKANLAAIAYHFGSKEALHVAVAEHIIARIMLS